MKLFENMVFRFYIVICYFDVSQRPNIFRYQIVLDIPCFAI